LVFFIASTCYGDTYNQNKSFPDIPEKHFPSVKTIPSQGEIILESRGVGKTAKFEIGIFNLTDRSEYTWDLPAKILTPIVPQQRPYSNAQASSWAAQTGQLLLSLVGAIYLINRDGSYSEVHLKMPGHLAPYDGMSTYALTNDAQSVAYSLYTRDIGDRQPDGFGRLYTHLMYQKLEGSEPITISKDAVQYRPDWSPDGTKIAFRTTIEQTFVASDGKTVSKVESEKKLVIADISGRVIVSVDPRDKKMPLRWPEAEVTEIRWDPNGNRLAFLYYGKLYMVNADGGDFKAIEFKEVDKESKIESFAWSPSGKQFVFRSTYKAREICNYNFIFHFEVGHFPCIQGSHLFTSNIDGSNLKQITGDPAYRVGRLFWIQ
jgi:hypothetical protein